MNDTELEVDRAIIGLQLGTESIRKLPPDEADAVVGELRKTYVDGDPRALWLGLKQPFRSFPYSRSEWPSCLVTALAAVHARVVWLVVEAESRELVVYRIAQLEAVPRVLAECTFFEYYLVDCGFRWLIADTDHNEILVAKADELTLD